jgi:hypothetical protein
MAIECGLGVEASNLKDERLVSVKKVTKLRPLRLLLKDTADAFFTGSLHSQYSDSGRTHGISHHCMHSINQALPHERAIRSDGRANNRTVRTTHASKKDIRSTTLSQNESRSEPRVRKGKDFNIEQAAGHDAQYQGPGVCTRSEEVHSRTRVRGGMPSEQAEETESMRGLTSDVNHEKHEFTLDFADGESRHSSLN